MVDTTSIYEGEARDFLTRYLNHNSPTGFESGGQRLWSDYVRAFADEVHLDDYGTAYAVINPGQSTRVVIEAHADEISWFVHYITAEGFIHVIRNGGSDPHVAPSKRVKIFGEQGVVTGVFGWPAIHTRHGDNKLTPKLDNIFIDIGANTKDEVLARGVDVGSVVVFDDDLLELGDKYFVGRALDNRMGGFAIAQVARLLKENAVELPFSLYVVNSVQEEIGLRGAQMIAARIKPQAALVVDVTHDTNTPHIDKKKHGDVKLGGGPGVTYAPAVHQKLLRLVLDAAKDNEIPVQKEASSRSTGTDTDAFAYSGQGVPSALVSIPLRYMHTTVETAHRDDVACVVGLLYHALQRIEADHNWKYF